MTTTTAPRILSVAFDTTDDFGYTREFTVADPTDPTGEVSLTFRHTGAWDGASLEDGYGDEVEPADYGFEDIYQVDELTAQAQHERAEAVRAFLSTGDVPADVAETVRLLMVAQRI